MTNRLDYQTIGGEFSASTTFDQLIEFCRFAQEDCRQLSDWALIHESRRKAAAWKKIADNFEKVIAVLTHLAKGKTQSSVGYQKSS